MDKYIVYMCEVLARYVDYSNKNEISLFEPKIITMLTLLR